MSKACQPCRTNWVTSSPLARASALRLSQTAKALLYVLHVPKRWTRPLEPVLSTTPPQSEKNVCFRCDDDTAQQFLNIDAAIGSYIEDNATRLFKGKNMIYKPALQTKEDFAPLLRCKINMGGREPADFGTRTAFAARRPRTSKAACSSPEFTFEAYGSWVARPGCNAK